MDSSTNIDSTPTRFRVYSAILKVGLGLTSTVAAYSSIFGSPWIDGHQPPKGSQYTLPIFLVVMALIVAGRVGNIRRKLKLSFRPYHVLPTAVLAIRVYGITIALGLLTWVNAIGSLVPVSIYCLYCFILILWSEFASLRYVDRVGRLVRNLFDTVLPIAFLIAFVTPENAESTAPPFLLMVMLPVFVSAKYLDNTLLRGITSTIGPIAAVAVCGLKLHSARDTILLCYPYMIALLMAALGPRMEREKHADLFILQGKAREILRDSRWKDEVKGLLLHVCSALHYSQIVILSVTFHQGVKQWSIVEGAARFNQDFKPGGVLNVQSESRLAEIADGKRRSVGSSGALKRQLLSLGLFDCNAVAKTQKEMSYAIGRASIGCDEGQVIVLGVNKLSPTSAFIVTPVERDVILLTTIAEGVAARIGTELVSSSRNRELHAPS